MIALLLTILSSTIIFVVFKYFAHYKIDTFQAIIFNYFTAFCCGMLFTDEPWQDISLNLHNWGIYAAVCSVLFISLFLIMALSSQQNGVSSTSVAVKMSMAVSLLSIMLYHGESISLLRIAGMIAAFCGVYFMAAGKGTEKPAAAWMLFVLFVGSGLLDFALNFVEQLHLSPFNSSMFTAFGFLFAGSIGTLILSVQIIRRKAQLKGKNVLAGIILGVPNYFSIYMLIESYRQLNWNDSSILAIINVSVVVLSGIIGFSIFRERLTTRKVIGFTLALTAITLLALAMHG